MKPTITNYQEFIKSHRKYSRSPDFNMDRHGYSCVIRSDLEVFAGDKTQKSRDAVQGYINLVGEESYSEYVYYRTQDGWGLPYIFIYAKV